MAVEISLYPDYLNPVWGEPSYFSPGMMWYEHSAKIKADGQRAYMSGSLIVREGETFGALTEITKPEGLPEAFRPYINEIYGMGSDFSSNENAQLDRYLNTAAPRPIQIVYSGGKTRLFADLRGQLNSGWSVEAKTRMLMLDLVSWPLFTAAGDFLGGPPGAVVPGRAWQGISRRA